MFLLRPRMNMFPFRSITPRSPVLSHPSGVKAAAVASGLR